MTITVKLFATYRAGRFKVEEQDYPAGIGIILVNGRHAEADQQLQDHDILALFPLVGGG